MKREIRMIGGKLIPVICIKKEVSEMLKANTRYLTNQLQISINNRKCQL